MQAAAHIPWFLVFILELSFRRTDGFQPPLAGTRHHILTPEQQLTSNHLAGLPTTRHHKFPTSTSTRLFNDLWQRLDAAQARHEVLWEWVKGHAGHDGNERADKLATARIKNLKAAAK